MTKEPCYLARLPPELLDKILSKLVEMDPSYDAVFHLMATCRDFKDFCTSFFHKKYPSPLIRLPRKLLYKILKELDEDDHHLYSIYRLKKTCVYLKNFCTKFDEMYYSDYYFDNYYDDVRGTRDLDFVYDSD